MSSPVALCCSPLPGHSRKCPGFFFYTFFLVTLTAAPYDIFEYQKRLVIDFGNTFGFSVASTKVVFIKTGVVSITTFFVPFLVIHTSYVLPTRAHMRPVFAFS